MNMKWKVLIGLSLAADLMIGVTIVAKDVYYDDVLTQMAQQMVYSHKRINGQIKALEGAD